MSDDFFAAHYWGTRVDRRDVVSGSVMEFRHPPGVALGWTAPSMIEEREKRKQILIKDFLNAVEAGALLASDMIETDETDLHDFDIWKSALIKMIPYIGLVTAPLVQPLQLGGVSFEWHDVGMNIEIRFRGEQDIFVVVEDVKQETPEFFGKDSFLLRAGQALDMLIQRQS